jgi:hypothetical protein
MTYEEALAKRNQIRELRNSAKEELEVLADNKLVEGMMNAEYSWGYWDAVITIMKELKLKEIKV